MEKSASIISRLRLQNISRKSEYIEELRIENEKLRMKEKSSGVFSYFSIFQFSIPKVLLVMTLITSSLQAQHTNHEIAFSFAYAGQSPFITSNDESGFFRQPVIWNLRYQVVTNYVQSISV